MKRLNKNWFIATGIAIAACWAVLFTCTTIAKTTSDKVNDAKENVEQSKDDLEKSKSELAQLEDAKAQLEGKLADLNEELNEVSAQLESAQDDLLQKQQAIENVKVELARAEDLEKEQYESMKLRIRYMYENDTDMMQMLLEGDGITDLLNKVDFLNEMAQYDRKMLNEYSATKDSIANSKVILEQEEQALQQVVAQVKSKQEEVNHLVSETSKKIAQQTENIESAEQKALAYERKLNEQRNTLKALEAQEAEEKAIIERQKKEQKKQQESKASGSDKTKESAGQSDSSKSSSTANGYGQATDSSETKLLATIIYCEAGNQPYEGKVAVGSVVMNRINSSQFPNTLLGVLYQKSQFTPVMSGRFAVALANDSATDSCYEAARAVLGGANNVPDCLFFRTVIPGKNGKIIGDHVFY